MSIDKNDDGSYSLNGILQEDLSSVRNMILSTNLPERRIFSSLVKQIDNYI